MNIINRTGIEIEMIWLYHKITIVLETTEYIIEQI